MVSAFSVPSAACWIKQGSMCPVWSWWRMCNAPRVGRGEEHTKVTAHVAGSTSSQPKGASRRALLPASQPTRQILPEMLDWLVGCPVVISQLQSSPVDGTSLGWDAPQPPSLLDHVPANQGQLRWKPLCCRVGTQWPAGEQTQPLLVHHHPVGASTWSLKWKGKSIK